MRHREGMYVQVVGPLKKFQDKISISAFSLLPVLDSNQITAHLLDTLYAHLRFVKGALDVSLWEGCRGLNACVFHARMCACACACSLEHAMLHAMQAVVETV